MIENLNITATREDAYRLLAACYYPPSKELLEENCCGTLATLLASVAPDAAQHAADAALVVGDSSLEDLAVEHARLFIGPFQLVAPPYGSIYLDDTKTVMGDSTARVAAFYHNCGLRLAEDFHELPDHFAVELEFMSFLAFKQREAEQSGDTGETGRIVSLQKEFLGRFLLPWLEPFTSAIINDGETSFYQAVAHCSAAFINADYNSLTSAKNG
ncbi:MAG: molecular chaperone TorD family protein [Deltaproteobacteria bacterium]|nr:molecular chaperone TorD family protein [Deltaproteobacteria bacterium]